MKGPKNFVYNITGISVFPGAKGELKCDMPQTSNKYNTPLEVVEPPPEFKEAGINSQLRKELNAIGRWVVLWRTGEVAKVLMQDNEVAMVELLGKKGIMNVPNREWLEFTPDMKRVARNTSLTRVNGFFTQVIDGEYDDTFRKMKAGRKKNLAMSLALRIAPEKAPLFGKDGEEYVRSIVCALDEPLILGVLAMSGDKRWMLSGSPALTKAKAAARAGTLFVIYQKDQTVMNLLQHDEKFSTSELTDLLKISQSEQVDHQTKMLETAIEKTSRPIPAIHRVKSVKNFQDETYRVSPPVSPRRPSTPPSAMDPQRVRTPSPPKIPSVEDFPSPLPPPPPELSPEEFFKKVPSPAKIPLESEKEKEVVEEEEPVAEEEKKEEEDLAKALQLGLLKRRASLEDEEEEEDDEEEFDERFAPRLVEEIDEITKPESTKTQVKGLSDMAAELARAGYTRADALTFEEAHDLLELKKSNFGKFAEAREARRRETEKKIMEETERFSRLKPEAQDLAFAVAFGSDAEMAKKTRDEKIRIYVIRMVDPLSHRIAATPKVSRAVDAVSVDISEARRKLAEKLGVKQ